ncbi:hypothetical protein ACFLWL_00545 [Chloroflexota bacterium]
MSKNRVKKSHKLIVFALFLSILLLFLPSCAITDEDETALVERLLQKVGTVDGEITIVTKEGETVTITITKDTSSGSQADDNTKDQQLNLQVDKDSSESTGLVSILPSLECIEDVYKVLGVWEDAHTLREKGLNWSHVASELDYSEDTMYAQLQEIAEERLKDAKQSGLINQELLEKKFAYFSDINLKWVNKIFADTNKEEKAEEEKIEKFEGIIKVIDGHIWKVSVEDEIRIVDVSEAAIRVEPEIGVRVVIAGIVEDNITIALEIDEAD